MCVMVLIEVARWPFDCIISMPCVSEIFLCASMLLIQVVNHLDRTSG